MQLISELAKESRKAPGRKYDDKFEEVYEPMDDETKQVVDMLRRYVYKKTTWYSDIEQQKEVRVSGRYFPFDSKMFNTLFYFIDSVLEFIAQNRDDS